ncbi:MAG: type protein secretion protein-like protein [Deltaproteobacteria bacterium]|nr:type protein secretion protein-like protein [Deltaproteobacteria bacterium]
MVKDTVRLTRFLHHSMVVLFIFFVAACSSYTVKKEIEIPSETRQARVAPPKQVEMRAPDFVPATEDISPLRTRIVDVVARNTPLRDVLHVIAEATNLNLVMEKGVAPETPVTISLRNVTAEDALRTILSSVDYFYSVKDTMLFVKAYDTKVFEVGIPPVVQSYNVEVGGNIFGGVTGNIAPASTGGGGSAATTGTATTEIKGTISQTLKSDEASFKFWDSVEHSIAGLLGQGTTASPGQVVKGVKTGDEYFTINRLTGTIIVTATKKNLERVEQFLGRIKKVMTRQVLIEAKVIEVTLSQGYQFGIDWNLTFNLGGKWSGAVGLGNSGFSSVVPSTSPVFSIGTGDEGISRSFSHGTIESINIKALVNALEQQGDVRLLSNPRINMMNGQTAMLTVGRNTAYISQIESTTLQGTNPVVTFTVGTSSILSGIAIGIVPFVNDVGEISLTITPIVSELVSLDTKNIGSTANQLQISLPTVDLRELSTTAKVKDGQVVVVGGLTRRSERVKENQTPFLGKLPLVGGLFRSSDRGEVSTELVIILQPVLL